MSKDRLLGEYQMLVPRAHGKSRLLADFDPVTHIKAIKGKKCI